jgi:hypothetical protein
VIEGTGVTQLRYRVARGSAGNARAGEQVRQMAQAGR